MAYEYKEPDVVETHTTRNVVVDREPSSSGWAVVLVLAVLVVLGLVGYFALSGGSSTDRGGNTTVHVDTPAATERAQDINIESPDVNVAPPTVNIEPPAVTPPTTTTTGGESGAGTTGD
jgi:hypothetical protein